MSRFDPFAPAGPRWWAVAAHRPFLRDVAAGLLDWLGPEPPERLSDLLVLLPNRRAARAFTAALAEVSDRPVLLPQVRPLGDLEADEPPFTPGALGFDLPPPLDPLTRRFELAALAARLMDHPAPVRALALGEALGGFLDAVYLEEVERPGRVVDLVEADLAEHWREAARLLGGALELWPARLAELGASDPSQRRAALLRRLAEHWDAAPPAHPVIAAGSTGTLPAAAAVLAAVAGAPQGAVILPGLDLDLPDPVWDQIEDQHPQAALKALLTRAGVAREAVRTWPAPEDARGRARQRLLNEALRPAEATDAWRGALKAWTAREAGSGREPVREALAGLRTLTARHEDEAAAAIALKMRQALETPGLTCALVSPDLDLSRRVEARLARWGVRPDVSAGVPLDQTPAGGLVELVARWLAAPLSPHLILAALKHPLTTLPGAPEALAGRDALEAAALRDAPPRDLADLRKRLLKAREPDRRGRPPSADQLGQLARADALVTVLDQALAAARAPFAPEAPAGDAARALVGLVETLAGPEAWSGADGEAAAGLLTRLIEAGPALGPVSRDDLPALVRELLAAEPIRQGGATHPRLRILGAIEARLVRADVMILAGLEEGVWPAGPQVDPFLSRAMRKALDLPSPERRLGQTAQDFVQAAAAPDVTLVHIERRGGQPTVRSRWLWRLEMMAMGAKAAPEVDTATIALARALDAPAGPARLAPPPTPRPPLARRPSSLYVTAIERWVRDPYAIYARYILGLDRLRRPGESFAAAARGDAVHTAIERLGERHPDAVPADAAAQLEHDILAGLVEAGFGPAELAREQVLARTTAAWLAAFERRRRRPGLTRAVEASGALTLDLTGGPFTLKARADRIEVADGRAEVLDFKTGMTPTRKAVAAGFSPQLTLTAAILQAGGFDGLPAAPPAALTYVRLSGRGEGGEEIDVGAPAGKDPRTAEDLAAEALDGLRRRVEAYRDPATPYRSWTAPRFARGLDGDYDVLARVWEWRVVGDDGAAEEGS
ncbi:MAG TPA: double-strand break repair protein AddB [Brevundimonas sp.]|jgi:ATP-dependent helicase/nuclease subunit B|uniref:double-strand break repair protein AddB n=1 Tax=Brevundimonas sp. TaxID=1871086 RepID=UPI002E131EFE|nr:double-strand break repair protein AddB [Brevundimonas sp.]